MEKKLRLGVPRTAAKMPLDQGQAAAVSQLVKRVSAVSPGGQAAGTSGTSGTILGGSVNPPAPGGLFVVTGAPGAGRTRVLLELAARLSNPTAAGDGYCCGTGSNRGLSLVVPDRARAEALMNTDRAQEIAGARPIMTPGALAFATLVEYSEITGQIPPQLLTGADEQTVVTAILRDLYQEGEFWPDQLSADTLNFDALIRQVREAAATAADLRLESDVLKHLAQEPGGNPLWALVGHVMEAFAVDPRLPIGAMIARAQEVVTRAIGDGLSGRLLERTGVVIVDDAQDLTRGIISFLAALRSAGCTLVLSSCPDTATESYRGADVEALSSWLESELTETDQVIDLGASRRCPVRLMQLTEPIRAYCDNLMERPHASERLPQRAWLSVTTQQQTAVAGEFTTEAFASATHLEQALIAQLQYWHLVAGVAWDQLAVLTREAAMAGRIAELAQQAQIPVARRNTVIKFADDPLIGSLLRICLEPDNMRQILCSPLVQMPPRAVSAVCEFHDLRVQYAGLARAVGNYSTVSVGTASGGTASSDSDNPDGDEAAIQELVRLLGTTDEHMVGNQAFASPPSNDPEAEQLIQLLQAARLAFRDSFGEPIPGVAKAYQLACRIQQAARAQSGNPQQDLWSLWEAADVALEWQKFALDGNVTYDRLLDAAVVLFRHLDIYLQRNPQTTTHAYCEQQLASDIQQDTIARGAPTNDGVKIGTVAQVAGSSFKHVIILGLQQGQWPNPRVRDGIFTMSRLARMDGQAPLSIGAAYRADYQRTLIGEMRWLIHALTRVSDSCTAYYVNSGEESPSFALEMLQQQWQLISEQQQTDAAKQMHAATTVQEREQYRADTASKDTDESRPVRALMRLGLRGIVGQLRQATIDPQALAVAQTGEEIPNSEAFIYHQAVELLAKMAQSGVRAADPQLWAGIGNDPATNLTLVGNPWRGKVTLSPSKVENLLQCPARWAWEQLGARRPATEAQTLGTFVHALAEEFATTASQLPNLEDEFVRRVWQQWPEDGLISTKVVRARALEIVNKLAKYLVHFDKSRTAVGAELYAAEVAYFGHYQGEPPSRERTQIAPNVNGSNHGDTDQSSADQSGTNFGGVNIFGVVDRVEIVPDSEGQPLTRIVDFKTGGSALTKTQAEENPQLAVYQWLLQNGREIDPVENAQAEAPASAAKHQRGSKKLPPPGGGKLIYLRLGEDAAIERAQSSDGAALGESYLADAVELALNDSFAARANDGCVYCAMQEFCPLYQSERTLP